MKDKTIRLKNASLITEEGDVLSGRDVLIKSGRIEKIAALPDHTQETAEDVIDCSGLCVSPGIPNLHVHTAMNIFKGIAEDVNSDQWFNEMIFPYESKMTEWDVYLGTKLGIAEMISNGVTVFADHYFMEGKVLRAVLDTGIRADLAPTVFGMAPDVKDRLSEVKNFIRQHKNDSDRIAFHMGPHADYTCPPQAMGEIVDAAKDMDLPLHLHIAEEEAQLKLSEETYGESPFAYMDRFGAYDLKILFAHGLWITEEDLKYLRDDTMFAFCPKTYMKLGSGKGGFFDVHERLSFGFGTDGAASSNTLSPVEQARLFALLGKFQSRDGREYETKTIWKRLMEGHKAFPFGTGHMKEGAPADLVIWDLGTPDTFPVYHPVTSILYSSNSSNVRDVIVGGEFLKRDGKLCLDEKKLLKEVREAQQSLLGRGKGTAAVTYLRKD